jgi:four helix bundle protein
MPLNIADGAGEYASVDKARFYRIARRSATESAAIVDACRTLRLADLTTENTARELLLRIAAMLTAMVLRLDQSGSRSRSGSGSG